MQCNVQNTGSEIAPENIKYIFDRFYKEDKSRGINKTGSGLGLYIVKMCIRDRIMTMLLNFGIM